MGYSQFSAINQATRKAIMEMEVTEKGWFRLQFYRF